MNESKRIDCLHTVATLYEKYKDDDYMLKRIYNHIHVYLPNTLENENKNNEKRHNLYTHLSEEQQIFIQVFLSKHNYYYLPALNFYYEYNGLDYLIVKEDDIIHKLLSTISKDRTLLKWKHKTRSVIIKRIKERNLFTSTPETETIQNVLNSLYPTFFPSKNSAKYFLTIIGDTILKKNTDLIFMITPKTKQFIEDVEYLANNSIGTSNSSIKFLTKYHENHSFLNYRLIKMNEIYSLDFWREILKKIGLNLLCVAAHYSTRYVNSDNFINSSLDEELSSYTYTLKNTTQNELIDNFIDGFIEKTSDDFRIEWKKIHFIWKQFLFNTDLPNVIFSNVLKNYFKLKYTFDEKTDSFIGITSKYLPIYKDFIQFWNTTMSTTVASSQYQNFENDIEIEEISSLFKFWNKSKTSLSEENIVRILKHFFVIDFVENKYVLHVSSSIWDKFSDIEQSITYIKQQCKEHITSSLISFDDLYNYYQKRCKNASLKFVVSKRYFQKYLYFKYSDYIVYERFITFEWVV